MSLRDVPKRVWALFTALEEIDGTQTLEGSPFTGVRVTVDPAQRCQLDWCQDGNVGGSYREELLPLDQRKVVWGLDENMDMDDLERVLYDNELFDGSVLHCAKRWRRGPVVWTLTGYRSGELTGNWLGWYSDGRLQEYSKELKLDRSGLILEQRFEWYEHGGLRSSFLRTGDRRGTSADAPFVRLDDRGRLCELSWASPDRFLGLVPEVHDLAEGELFLVPADLAGISLGQELRLSFPQLQPDLLEVLLADGNPAELERLSCWLHAHDLQRVLDSAPRLRQVQYNGPAHPTEVDAMLNRWRSGAPDRTFELG